MTKNILVLIIMLIAGISVSGQSVIGTWKNIEKGELQSHIKVFEQDGKLYAQVTELFETSKVTHCKKCKGDDKGASLKDIHIFYGLEKDGDKWKDGKILDPKRGKEYGCLVELKDANTLKVRGYMGNPLFGKSFYWYRVE